ncbi:uncharacterized protein METZ01_LOCUS167686, partial [marine metagenome]
VDGRTVGHVEPDAIQTHQPVVA